MCSFNPPLVYQGTLSSTLLHLLLLTLSYIYIYLYLLSTHTIIYLTFHSLWTCNQVHGAIRVRYTIPNPNTYSMDTLHHMDATTSEGMPFLTLTLLECTPVFAQTFASALFPTIFHVPSYAKHLISMNFLDTLKYHKKVLQKLESLNNDIHPNWIVKSPQYTHSKKYFLSNPV